MIQYLKPEKTNDWSKEDDDDRFDACLTNFINATSSLLTSFEIFKKSTFPVAFLFYPLLIYDDYLGTEIIDGRRASR